MNLDHVYFEDGTTVYSVRGDLRSTASTLRADDLASLHRTVLGSITDAALATTFRTSCRRLSENDSLTGEQIGATMALAHYRRAHNLGNANLEEVARQIARERDVSTLIMR